jgi:hypothetical protein
MSVWLHDDDCERCRLGRARARQQRWAGTVPYLVVVLGIITILTAIRSW